MFSPSPVDRGTTITGQARTDRAIHIHSREIGRTEIIALDKLAAEAVSPWSRYTLGVVDQFRRNDLPIEGFDAGNLRQPAHRRGPEQQRLAGKRHGTFPGKTLRRQTRTDANGPPFPESRARFCRRALRICSTRSPRS